MTNPYRALCAELADALAEWRLGGGPPEDTADADLIERARALLAQPVAEGPSLSDVTELFYRRMGGGSEVGFEDAIAEALARWGRPTPQPVAVSERLPGAEDCIKRGNDHWCWGQERSLLTNQASARWRLMRLSALTDEAVNWLPANALPTPEAKP